MLTAETKRHIDAARDVLVGKVPDPKSQVQEITNALIYKFMDDMDDRAVTMGGKRRFFTDEYEKFSWRKIMDPRIGAHERIGLYTEALARLSKNPNLPELFRGIFRNAYLPFNDGRTLTLFLTEIDFFDYRHQEELGDAYEYLLSIMGSQGDAGQFRTPRHIIDFIVKVVNPTKDDTVLDPACGTAGFLISAYKHVLSKHDGKEDPTKSEKPLSADEKRKLHESYRGFDIDDNMVKMAQVNLYLHGFPNPNVLVHDTLSSEDYWQDRYSVIMANPPFMTPKGGIVPHNKFGVQSNRAEVLFVDYIMSHLKPNGRAGIIVPEGIIFQSTTAHKQLRKNLITDGLYAVVSLPSGIFQPYSGVKTSILFFDNTLAKQTPNLLFLEIKDVGFSLGATGRTIEENDIPRSISIIKQFQKGEKFDSVKYAFITSKTDIANNDYDLTASKYRKTTNDNSSISFIPLGDITNITKGKSSSTKTTPGLFPLFLTAEVNKTSDSFDFDGEGVCVPLISATGHGKAAIKRIHYVSGKFALANLLAFVQPKNNREVSPRYLYWILNSAKDMMARLMKGAANVGMKVDDLERFQVPLPPLEIQQQIVAELDGYQNIITGARQVVDNWKPHIDIDPGWEKVSLGELCQFIDYRGKTPIKTKSGIPLITAKNVKMGYISTEPQEFISDNNYDEWMTRGIPQKGDVLITTEAPLGNVAQINFDNKFALAQRIISLTPNRDKINDTFLMYILTTNYMQQNILSKQSGSTVYGIKASTLRTVIVPVPPYQTQTTIVKSINAEREIVEANKNLIAIYEQKMKDVIARLWNDKTG